MPAEAGIDARFPQINTPAVFIGKHNVIKTILVEVHKPQTLACMMDVIGQGLRSWAPVFLFGIPAVVTGAFLLSFAIGVDIALEAQTRTRVADLRGESLEVVSHILFHIDREPALRARAQ